MTAMINTMSRMMIGVFLFLEDGLEFEFGAVFSIAGLSLIIDYIVADWEGFQKREFVI